MNIVPVLPVENSVPAAQSSGRATASRRTFGRRGVPSRRTFGRRIIPSRRTFGRRALP